MSVPAAEPWETWSVRKPAVESAGGLVATQHRAASAVGARVLADGGNAVDAAVAAGLAIGTVEPWMSGLGGGGFMLVHRAAEGRTFAVDFGMRAPAGLDPDDYPVVEGADADLFGWPAVREQRNVVGPYSFAVPGFVAGHALALERFGTLGWADALAPAIGIAEAGMPVDWYATLKIAAAAPDLARFPASAETYLPGGFVPAGQWGGPLSSIRLGHLAATLRALAERGPRDFYEGAIAESIAADCAALGASLAREDLAGYAARVLDAGETAYRGARVRYAPGLTAGPTLADALARLEACHAPGARPDAAAFRAYAASLDAAYARRFETMGDDGDGAGTGCTTHISVVDREGNLVALTQTLLSVFGSRVVLPSTGILMNNGIMWFDPRPGRPNSIRPGRRPLSNMCPTVVVRDDGTRFAMGASGGRRIMPAVYQLLSFVVDYRMSLEEAIHHGRIDVSGTAAVGVDRALGPEVAAAVGADLPIAVVEHGVYPALFACPNVVAHDPGRGANAGAAFVMSPWAKVAAERP